jgi:hypothetical protein
VIGKGLLYVALVYSVIAHFSSFFNDFSSEYFGDRWFFHVVYTGILFSSVLVILDRGNDFIHTGLSIFLSFRSFFLFLGLTLYVCFTFFFSAISFSDGWPKKSSSGQRYFVVDRLGEHVKEIDQSNFRVREAVRFRLATGYWMFSSYLAVLTLTSASTAAASRKSTDLNSV